MNKFGSIVFTATWVLVSGIHLLAQSGWNSLNSGTTVDLYAVHFVNADTGYTAGQTGIVLKTVDGGVTWENISPAGASNNFNGISAIGVGGDMVVAVGNGGMIMLTSDGGTNWSSVTSGVSDNLMAVSFSQNVGICGGTSQTILYSNTSGTSWNVSQSGFFGGGFFGARMLSPSIGFVGGQNSIFQPLAGKTTDSGANWNFSPFYLNNNEGRTYDVDFTDENIGYAASRVFDGTGAISNSTDGGINWTTTLVSTALFGINFPISNAGQAGYAVGEAGVILKTTDAGSSWQPLASGVTVTLNGVYFLDIDNGYVAGGAGTILKTTTGGQVPTSLNGTEIPGNPSHSITLSQNYPNPFNPSTTIEYSLPEEAEVVLQIYNLAGREVKTLLNERQASGHQSVTWDGRDDAGRPVSSGVYIYRLKTGDRVINKKLILLR